MIPAFEYIKNNSWQQLKKDFREYQKLKKTCNKLCRESLEAHSELVCDKAEYLEQYKPLKCIRGVTKDCFNMYDADGISVYFSTEYCGNFLPEYNSPKCQRKDCPYVELNNKAYELQKEYERLEQQKSEFWSRKFARQM